MGTWTRGAISGLLWIALGLGCSVGAGADDPAQLCSTPACQPWGGADDDDDDGDDGAGATGGGEGTGGDDGGGDGGPTADNRGLPCEVRDALAAHCGQCHGEAPAFGAPMSLLDHDDLHVPATSDLTRPVHELVGERLVAETGRMPPTAVLDDATLDLLVQYASDGAPKEPETDCGGPSGDPDPGEPVGPEALPCDDPQRLVAHEAGGPGPFHVPAQGADDLYQCFAFKSPFVAGAQSTAWAPIIDDERVIHHWILYRTTEPQPDGGTFPCDVSLQLSADFVAGWAPGGGNVQMPADVGLELGGPEDWYVLQVHYHNTANHEDAFDGSGVAFCVADTPRPQTAGVLTLGTVGLNIPAGATDHTETGTCGWLSTAFWPELHVIGSSPHMHELGRGLYAEVQHGDGSIEVITDVPAFDFNSQTMYFNQPEVLIEPGDTLRTTCRYDNPNPYDVGFGEGTGDEMCFDFVLVYPIQELQNRNCGIIF